MRWMSPELFYPDKSDLKGARPTKQSDCYAFGMVIYEVLSGQAPFLPFRWCVVVRKVIEGERPSRPNGPEGAQFTDDLWQMLNLCWEAQPERRPSVATALECLERVSRSLRTPSSPQSDESTGVDEDNWDIRSDSSGVSSWFSLRYFVGFLCGVLCLLQLQTAVRKTVPSEPSGGTDLGAS
jgi:hypothetical protein